MGTALASGGLTLASGYHGPPALTLTRAFTEWTFDPWMAALVVILGGGYLAGVRGRQDWTLAPRVSSLRPARRLPGHREDARGGPLPAGPDVRAGGADRAARPAGPAVSRARASDLPGHRGVPGRGPAYPGGHPLPPGPAPHLP